MMRSTHLGIIGYGFFALACAAGTAYAANWEAPGPLDATQLLGKTAVKSGHHSIEPKVENDGLMNRYVIASNYQRIGAYGDSLALERAREQEAMAALRQIKTTDSYVKGVASAAAAPLAVTKKLVTNPVGLVTSVPGAVGNLVGDVAGAVGGLGQAFSGGGGGGSTADKLSQLVGYQKVKGRLAFEMGVDAASSNSVLQTDLNDVAWAIFAGGASVDLAMTQAPMAASLAVAAAEHLHRAESPLWDIPESTLRQASSDVFHAANLPRDEANALAWHSSCTVTHQTAFASAVAELAGVAGRDAFARHANSASDEADCRSHVETARLLWTYHKERRPLASIQLTDGVVTATDTGGRTLLPLRADYVFWTAEAGRRVDALPQSGKRSVWLSGDASKATQAALRKRGNFEKSRSRFSRKASRPSSASSVM
jgi:hypothetical protein